MQAGIDTLDRHVIVCGASRIGGYVIDALRAKRRACVVVETDAATLERRLEADLRLLALHGDVADDDVLARAGIARAAGVFAVIRPQRVSLVDELLCAGERLAVEEVVVPHADRRARAQRGMAAGRGARRQRVALQPAA